MRSVVRWRRYSMSPSKGSSGCPSIGSGRNACIVVTGATLTPVAYFAIHSVGANMLLIEIKGLDQRLLDNDVLKYLDRVRRVDARPPVRFCTRDIIIPFWESEVESTLDRELRRADLPRIDGKTRINFDFGRWREHRESRVLVVVRQWTDLNWTYDLRLKMLVLIGRTLSHFLPVDWHIEALTQSRGDDAHLFARAGSLRNGDAAREDARA